MSSASEFEVFKILANPAVIDLDRKPRKGAVVISQALQEIETERAHLEEKQAVEFNEDRAGEEPEEKYEPMDNRHESEETMEKQAVLLELQQIERRGIKLSHDFTMRDSLSDMVFELNRLRSNLDTENMVAMLTNGLQLGMKGMEFANKTWGPVLHLDGWSNVVDSDRDKFKHVITKIYKKHWRRGASLSPEMELGLLLGGSALLNHFGHQLSNGGGTTGGGVSSFMNLFSSFGNFLGVHPPEPQHAHKQTERPSMRKPNFAPPQPNFPSQPNFFQPEIFMSPRFGHSFMVVADPPPRNAPDIEELI